MNLDFKKNIRENDVYFEEQALYLILVVRNYKLTLYNILYLNPGRKKTEVISRAEYRSTDNASPI